MLCGLPNVADAGHTLSHSPLGLCVVHNLREVVATDIMYAVIQYKWAGYAGRAFLLHSLLLLAYVAAFAVSSWHAMLKYRDGAGDSVQRVQQLYDLRTEWWRLLLELFVLAVNTL